jgi:VanZ family protein
MSRALASTKLGSHGTIVFPMIVTALYGILDELHQLYVPGRTFSYVDMGFDFLGASLVVFKNWWDKLFERVNL